MEDWTSTIKKIAHKCYNLSIQEGSIKMLPGYSDKNFKITAQGKTYVLKIITNEMESREDITDIIDELLENISDHVKIGRIMGAVDFFVPQIVRTSDNKSSSRVEVQLKSSESEPELRLCNVKLFQFVDGIHLMDVIRNSSSDDPCKDRELVESLHCKLACICRQMNLFMRRYEHLADRLKQIRVEQGFVWQLSTCSSDIKNKAAQLLAPLASQGNPDAEHKLNLVTNSMEYFHIRTSNYRNRYCLREYFIHGDLCSMNILVNSDRALEEPLCLLDFQDLQVGPRVAEIAIAILYQVLEQPGDFREALEAIPLRMLKAYHSDHSFLYPLAMLEIRLVPCLMILRLCQSLLNGLQAIQKTPENESYISISNRRGWELLEIMSSKEGGSIETRLVEGMSSSWPFK